MTSALAGKQIVNTRAAHQAADFDKLIRERDAVPVAYPCIDIIPPQDAAPLDDALRTLTDGRYDWLVLTSSNVVLVLKEHLGKLSLPEDVKVAAVGSSTALAAKTQLGLETDLIPDEFVAESLADAMKEYSGARVLLPQSDVARPTLAESLSRAGLAVTQVTAYQTVTGRGGQDVPAMLAAKQIDIITFTSPSTVRGFVERMELANNRPDTLSGVCIAAIGPVTARATGEAGLNIDVAPAKHTLEGMLTELEMHFERTALTS